MKKENERLKYELNEKEQIMAQANKQLEEYEADIKKMKKMKKENKIQNKHIEDLGKQIKQTQEQFASISEEYDQMISDYELTKNDLRDKEQELMIIVSRNKEVEDKLSSTLRIQEETSNKLMDIETNKRNDENLVMKYKRSYKLAKNEVRV